MKLYTGRIRAYKKWLGSSRSFEYLDWASYLKPGDLITTAKMYNEKIKSIEWEIRSYRSQQYVSEAWLYIVGGGVHSLFHGCSGLMSKNDLIDYHTSLGLEKSIEWFDDMKKQGWLNGCEKFESTIAGRLFNGEEVFDERGCLIKKD